MTALRLAAPAKLNLYLHVTAKRADNYHLLDGLVAFADVHDTLTITPADNLAFTADGPFAHALGPIDGNLVVKAARALAAATENRLRCHLHLTKILPVASGIGGGSADAAAGLRGLGRLWNIHPDEPVLREVAESLGADIPVCLDGRAGFIGGIGTDIAAAPALPDTWLVLVNPGIGLPTPDVYRARQGAFTPRMRFYKAPPDAQALADALAPTRNDLTAAAISLVPAIEQVLGVIAVTEGCLLSRMSGSGATCFGLYADPEGARRAGEAIRQDHPDWWVATGRLLDDVNGLTG